MSGDQVPVAIFLMGPTAAGKTELALALHDGLPVELISVDSSQVYPSFFQLIDHRGGANS